MIKWPWKAHETSRNADIEWEQALDVPILANLSADEQARLTQLATRFLQQKRMVPLQGLNLEPIHSARIAMRSASSRVQ